MRFTSLAILVGAAELLRFLSSREVAPIIDGTRLEPVAMDEDGAGVPGDNRAAER